MKALFMLAVAACVAAAQPQSANYTIAGTVIEHSSGRPLADILISIAPVGQNSEPLAMLSAADGRFSFPNLPAAKYALSAQRRGGRPQLYLQHNRYSTAIVTGPGLDSEHITFPLMTPARLTGTVIDADGDPVPDAGVTLVRQDYFDGVLQFVRMQMANTSQSGVFHFSNLPASRYYIAVQAHPWYAQHPNLMSGTPEPTGIPPELDAAYPITYSGDTTDPAAAQAIQLNEGAALEMRVTLHAVPAVNLILKGSGPETHPVRGYLVAYGLGGLAMRERGSMMATPEAVQLSAVAPGRYQLIGNIGSEHIQRTIDLTSNTTIEPSKENTPPNIARIILDDSGATPDKPRILLQSEAGRYIARPGADGSLLFDSVPPGRYRVLLNGSPEFYIKSISFNGAKAAGDFVVVTASAGFDLSVVVGRGAVDKVEGIVKHDGKPVSGEIVLLIPDDLSRASLIRRDQSDSDGSFTLPGVAPGRYTLLALDGDPNIAYREPAVIKPYLAHGQQVTISPGFAQHLEIDTIARK
jgi:hypothetical protein